MFHILLGFKEYRNKEFCRITSSTWVWFFSLSSATQKVALLFSVYSIIAPLTGNIPGLYQYAVHQTSAPIHPFSIYRQHYESIPFKMAAKDAPLFPSFLLHFLTFFPFLHLLIYSSFIHLSVWIHGCQF